MKKEKQYGTEGFGKRAPGKPLGDGVKSITRMGPILGGAVREDDYESLNGRDFAHQVYRVGQRRVERWPHKPEPRGYAPPHPGCARGGCESSGNLIRSQVRVGNVHSFIQF